MKPKFKALFPAFIVVFTIIAAAVYYNTTADSPERLFPGYQEIQTDSFTVAYWPTGSDLSTMTVKVESPYYDYQLYEDYRYTPRDSMDEPKWLLYKKGYMKLTHLYTDTTYVRIGNKELVIGIKK